MSFLNKIFSGNTLYYPGCLTKFVGLDLERKNRALLERIGLEFIVLTDLEKCCGSPLLKAGYQKDFAELAGQNHRLLIDHGVSRIISNCPACCLVFSRDYPEALKEWNISVAHTSQIFHQAWREGRLELRGSGGQVTYHDPCHLGRQAGIYQEPRELIRACGYELKEMDLSHGDGYCCGGGGGVQSNEPNLAERIGQERIDQARQTGAEFLCTSCPMCYLHLTRSTEKEKNSMKVVELTELLERSSNYE